MFHFCAILNLCYSKFNAKLLKIFSDQISKHKCLFFWVLRWSKYGEKISWTNSLFSEKSHCIHYNSSNLSSPPRMVMQIVLKSVDWLNFRNFQFAVAFRSKQTDWNVFQWADLNAKESAATVDSDTCLSISVIEILKPSSRENHLLLSPYFAHIQFTRQKCKKWSNENWSKSDDLRQNLWSAIILINYCRLIVRMYLHLISSVYFWLKYDTLSNQQRIQNKNGTQTKLIVSILYKKTEPEPEHTA